MIIQLNSSKDLAKALWLVYKKLNYEWFTDFVLDVVKNGQQFTSGPFRHIKTKIETYMESRSENNIDDRICEKFDRDAYHVLESMKISRNKWPMFFEIIFYGDVVHTIPSFTLYTSTDVNKKFKFKDLENFLNYHL